MSRHSRSACSSSGRTLTRVEIFSEKTRVHPAASSAASWLASSCRAVEQRAYPIRMGRPAGTSAVPASTAGPAPRAGRAAVRGRRDVQLLAQRGHEDEPGGVVPGGGLAAAGPAGAAGGGVALGAGMALDGCSLPALVSGPPGKSRRTASQKRGVLRGVLRNATWAGAPACSSPGRLSQPVIYESPPASRPRQ